MNLHNVQHLIEQALEHQITSGFTDEIYTKGRVCVSKAFTDKLIELILKECCNEIHAVDVGELQGKAFYLDRVAEHIEKHFDVSSVDLILIQVEL